jgi:O-antigen ligase
MMEMRAKVHYYTLLAIAACMPLSNRLTALLIAILVLNWIVDRNFFQKLTNMRRPGMVLLFGGFYLFYLSSMLWTTNTNAGWFDLEVKLSLVLLPLIMSTAPQISRKSSWWVLGAFIAGNLLAMVIDIGAWLPKAFESGSLYLHYKGFSLFHHPGYYSWYLNFCLVILSLALLGQSQGIIDNRKWLAIVILGLFSVMIFMLTAKMGIVVFVLLAVLALIVLLIMRHYKLAGVGIVVALLVMVSAWTLLPNTKERIKLSWQVLTDPDSVERTGRFAEGSTELRLLVWDAAQEVFKRNSLIGVGVGDAKDELLTEYERQEIYGATERNLNAHNQFLQTGVAIGLGGFLWLIAMLLIPLWQAIRSRAYEIVALLSLFILYALTESVLEIQAGVVFYAFFNALFAFRETRTASNS